VSKYVMKLSMMKLFSNDMKNILMKEGNYNENDDIENMNENNIEIIKIMNEYDIWWMIVMWY